MKRSRGTCSTFQSFLLISANVPCTYYVHRPVQSVWYVHVPYLQIGLYLQVIVYLLFTSHNTIAYMNVPLSSKRTWTPFRQPLLSQFSRIVEFSIGKVLSRGLIQKRLKLCETQVSQSFVLPTKSQNNFIKSNQILGFKRRCSELCANM